MSELLPNLPGLVSRLSEGCFARKLAEACLGCESADGLRASLRAALTDHLRGLVEGARHGEDTVD